MIEIVCDNCERLIEADPADAGGKVACPFCGDVNRVPDRPAEEDTAPERPGGEGLLLPGPGGPEQELCVVRPAMFRAHPFRFAIILILFLGGIVVAVTSGTERVWGGFLWPGVVLTVVAAGWWLLWWVAAHLWIKITITNKRTVRHEGIVRRHSTEVLHDHVRSVDIQQKFLQRILRVGYIGIDSAGQDGIEIEIRDIPGPYRIKKLIDRYRRM